MSLTSLIVAEPWASLIVDGGKTLELRPTRSHKIGETIGIIAKGTGTIIGTVVISGVVGPLTAAELDQLADQHMASADDLAAHPSWTFGWQLERAIRFDTAVPYDHTPGAQSWVTLTTLEGLSVGFATRAMTRRPVRRRQHGHSLR